jgi:predicted RNase H-like HicB family nuclease
MRRKTMVHVLDLLGCVANGPTTEAALDATPEAVSAYLRFLARCSEKVDPAAALEMRVEEHVTQGDWLGNGSPYLVFQPDLLPLEGDELEMLLHRYRCLRGELAFWADTQTPAQLDQKAASGRTPRAILLHVLGPTGAYLAAAVGGTTGFSRIQTQAERGEMPITEALRLTASMAVDRARETTPEQRAAVIQRPHDIRTLRKALRRMLEHEWEHLAELSRRPGGPVL